MYSINAYIKMFIRGNLSFNGNCTSFSIKPHHVLLITQRERETLFPLFFWRVTKNFILLHKHLRNAYNKGSDTRARILT